MFNENIIIGETKFGEKEWNIVCDAVASTPYQMSIERFANNQNVIRYLLSVWENYLTKHRSSGNLNFEDHLFIINPPTVEEVAYSVLSSEPTDSINNITSTNLIPGSILFRAYCKLPHFDASFKVISGEQVKGKFKKTQYSREEFELTLSSGAIVLNRSLDELEKPVVYQSTPGVYRPIVYYFSDFDAQWEQRLKEMGV